MSKIPYVYIPIPPEFLTDAFIEDIPMMKLVRYMFKRIRPFEHEELIKVNRHQVTVVLKPFEFIFGRLAAMKECDLTERQVRTRMEQLASQRYIRKTSSSPSEKTSIETSSKTSGNFTVYTLVTESFTKIDVQQNVQLSVQQNVQLNDHKAEAKKLEYRNKEANAAKPPASASFHNCLWKLPLSLEDKVDISRYPEDVVQRAVWWAEVKKNLTVVFIKGACNPKKEEYGNVIYNRWWIQHEIMADNDWAKEELQISSDFLKHKEIPNKEICFKCKPEAFQTQFFQVFVNVGAANEN